ncbi:MAG: hypothetical protein ACLPPV_21585, partial [Candidatus Korobacteraceae bacterium]
MRSPISKQNEPLRRTPQRALRRTSMPRSTRVEAQSRSGTVPVKAKSSSDSASSAASSSGSSAASSYGSSGYGSSGAARRGGDAGEASAFRLKGIDAAILALILGFALLLIAGTGFANGQ